MGESKIANVSHCHDVAASTTGSCHDAGITDVNSNHQHHHQHHRNCHQHQGHNQQNEHRPQDRFPPSSPMSTLLCCEPVTAGRPRANLKLVLNRSLSEPGPSPCAFPASPAASPIASSVISSNGADSGSGSLSSNSSSSNENVNCGPIPSIVIDEEVNGDDDRGSNDVHRRFHLHYHHHHHHHHHLHHLHHHQHLTATTKRCKLETVSLPTSPCAENGTLHRQLVLGRTRVVTSGDLAQRLARLEISRAGADSTVILDCRPFILYNVNHVRGAINVNCSDRFNRRRLQLGKATLADLTTIRENKELLRKRQFKEVIVYDDCTDDLDHLPAQHPLFLVLAALVDDNVEPALLIGKSLALLNRT